MVVGGPCHVMGCRRTSVYGSNMCYRHKDLRDQDQYSDDKSSPVNGKSESQKQCSSEPAKPESDEIGPKSEQMSGSVISYNIDGDDFSVPSKNIDDMIEALSGATRFWTVDLGLDEDEFVQYAIGNAELEHWDDRKMLESMEMEQSQAITILRQKLTGSDPAPGLWWDDHDTSENIQEGEADTDDSFVPLLIISSFVIIFFVFLTSMSDQPNSISETIGEMAADGCFELICGGGIALGGGAAALGRSEQGRFE